MAGRNIKHYPVKYVLLLLTLFAPLFWYFSLPWFVNTTATDYFVSTLIITIVYSVVWVTYLAIRNKIGE